MEWVSGNIFIRPNTLKTGETTVGHKHFFDHTTIFYTGEWHVKGVCPDGRIIEKDFIAPAHCLIKKDVEHTITCKKDGQYWCVYSHRNPQGEIVQDYDGWGTSYE